MDISQSSHYLIFGFCTATMVMAIPNYSFFNLKDACMVKPGFKPVPPQLYFEFAVLFLH